MPKVLVLPDHIASQIAAGEVIERPASIVKELVENSIDAGATQIEIAVSADCRDIRVADSGCGMDSDDAVLAFHRHATSKLVTADDLWSLRTMGFRGEALPSIAAVSRMTCYTRTADSPSGLKLEISDGKVSTTETGCAPGTVMEVTDLFYNVPARLKFLKKPATEFAHIHETVQALAISFPKITFQLLKQGEAVLRTSGSGKLAQAAVEAGFLPRTDELLPVTYADPGLGMAVYGYVSKPTEFRGDRKGILTIVNNRFVRCPLTYKALDYVYSDLIPKGRHPIAVLTITLQPNSLDVNVHPTKKEIKYQSGNDVYITIQRSIVEAIRTMDVPVPEQAQATESQIQAQQAAAEGAIAVREGAQPEPARIIHPRRTTGDQLRFSEKLVYVPPSARAAGVPAVSGATPPRRAALPAGWRLAAYIHNTYFVLETPEGMELIEQHIAHERVVYEHLLASQKVKGRTAETSQRLVISEPLALSAEQRETLESHLDALRALGFDFDTNQPAGVVLTAMPSELSQSDYKSTVQAILADLALTDSPEPDLNATKSVACQAAIKNGMPLSEADIVQLISDWLATERNDTCPHGRPVRLQFSMDKLFGLFHPK